MVVQPIPEGYHSITPCLSFVDSAQAIAFYEKAFGAVEKFRFAMPNGKISYAEMIIGDSSVMLGDENPEMGNKSPKTLGGSPMALYLYIKDIDQVVAQAVKEGAVLRQPIENKFYGDRVGVVEDPFGYSWYLATHVEDVSPEEMGKRAQKFYKG